MRIIGLLAPLVLVAIGATDVMAQSDVALFSRLDAIAGADVGEERAVGLVVAVVKGKDQLLFEAYGHADTDGGVAMSPNTVIPIGSVTKQFTAAAILQLREAGKLGLDDPMWLPEFEARGDGVTLRHLLGHTAGIPEFGQMQELHAMRLLMNPDVTRDSVYQVISRYAPGFPAGTMQVYSNIGYWLLGRVIERVRGMTYEEYVETRIFEPLGMTRSMYCDNSKNIPDRAGRRGSMEMVVAVSPSPDGLVASINDAAAIPLTWIEGWTFRTRAPQLTFRRSGNDGPASELRFDTGGDHIILKRQ